MNRINYLLVALMISSTVVASEIKSYKASVVPPKMSVKEKKKRFFALVNPVVQKVHLELMREFLAAQKDMKNGTSKGKIQNLKEKYGVTTDMQLLLALKPHPQSICLAQAAMESAWATSRFFVEANNLFGVWSYNSKEPRIAANEKRGGTKTIWLKKFATIEASVRAYYKLMASAKAYKAFREVRYKTDDPYKIILKLNNYSEMREKYPVELAKVIRYNKLTKYDIK